MSLSRLLALWFAWRALSAAGAPLAAVANRARELTSQVRDAADAAEIRLIYARARYAAALPRRARKN